MDAARHSCLKLLVPNPQNPNKIEPIFVKATWFDTHFDLAITNGLDAWVCQASEEEVRDRAAQWDQPLSEYLELAERHLAFQQPGSVYKFNDAGDAHRRLSWTFEKQGIKLEWRWKCQPCADCRATSAGILDFLMDSNIRLSEEVVNKTNSFDRLKMEAEKCLAQSERFSNEKREFESATYAKFVTILNSKKAKLRELRDQIGEREMNEGKCLREQDEESSDETESFDKESEDDTEIISKDGRGGE